MCLGPHDAKSESLFSIQKFMTISSFLCFGIYTSVLTILLYAFNDANANIHFEKWEGLYMNPKDPDDLFKLNLMISSLIVSGFMSTVLLQRKHISADDMSYTFQNKTLFPYYRVFKSKRYKLNYYCAGYLDPTELRLVTFFY